MPNNNPIDTEALAKFLDAANKSTYANKDAPKVSSTRLGSEDYHFEQGDLIYHDTYFGARDFMGEEIVYKNKKPVWGTNYFGFILSDQLTEKEVYDFLREALMQGYSDIIPVRGPREFSDGKWTYRFTVKGGLENFLGEEEIFLDNEVVYRAYIHGGFIK